MSHIRENLQLDKMEYAETTDIANEMNENVKLQNKNIKERLNLHVKKRLSGNALMNSEIPRKQLFKPIQTVDMPTVRSAANDSMKPVQKQQKQRRPYTKRKDKSNVEKSLNITATDCPTSAKVCANKIKPMEGAAPIAHRHKRTSVGDNADGADEESQDVESYGRLSDKDKNVDILSLVLSSKKRALLQHPEVQDVLHRILTIYNKDVC